MNRWVDQIGMMTGWTRGQITETCTDEFVYYPGVGTRYLLCQYAANYTRKGGDSGAPVIFVADAGDPLVIDVVGLAGTHVAGSGGRSLFSPLDNIEADFSLNWNVCYLLYC